MEQLEDCEDYESWRHNDKADEEVTAVVQQCPALQNVDQLHVEECHDTLGDLCALSPRTSRSGYHSRNAQTHYLSHIVEISEGKPASLPFVTAHSATPTATATTTITSAVTADSAPPTSWAIPSWLRNSIQTLFYFNPEQRVFPEPFPSTSVENASEKYAFEELESTSSCRPVDGSSRPNFNGNCDIQFDSFQQDGAVISSSNSHHRETSVTTRAFPSEMLTSMSAIFEIQSVESPREAIVDVESNQSEDDVTEVLPRSKPRQKESNKTIPLTGEGSQSQINDSASVLSVQSSSKPSRHKRQQQGTNSEDRSIKSHSSSESTNQKIHNLEESIMKAMSVHREATAFDIWAFVVTVVIGGTYYGWNAGFSAGFGSYAMAQLLVALAFVILACSLAEIVSTVSFSGGAYGMARVVLGFHAGFTIAMFELLEYVVYLSQSAQYIGESVAMQLHAGPSMSAVFSLIFFVFCGVVVLAGDRWFWRVNGTLAVVSLFVLLAYCLGSLPHVDFAQNATFGSNSGSFVAAENWFVGGLRGFIHVLPFTTWMFGGLESAALLSDMTAEPRKNVPNGIVAGTLTLLAMGLLMLFITASLPPGLPQLYRSGHLMDYGWRFMGVGRAGSHWLTLPAQVAMGFGFVLPATKLLRAMVTSKLFPTSFPNDKDGKRSSRVCLVIVLVLGMCVCFWSMKQPSLALENIPILFAQVTYLSNLFAFYKLRTDFSSRENMFRSPFGLVGAAYAAFIFFLVAISVIGFQDSIAPPFFVFMVFLSLTAYYYAYAKKRQHFSDDEQKSLLVLHVIRNNRNKKRVKKSVKR